MIHTPKVLQGRCCVRGTFGRDFLEEGLEGGNWEHRGFRSIGSPSATRSSLHPKCTYVPAVSSCATFLHSAISCNQVRAHNVGPWKRMRLGDSQNKWNPFGQEAKTERGNEIAKSQELPMGKGGRGQLAKTMTRCSLSTGQPFRCPQRTPPQLACNQTRTVTTHFGWVGGNRWVLNKSSFSGRSCARISEKENKLGGCDKLFHCSDNSLDFQHCLSPRPQNTSSFVARWLGKMRHSRTLGYSQGHDAHLACRHTWPPALISHKKLLGYLRWSRIL